MNPTKLHNSIVLMYHRLGNPFVRSTVRGQYVLPAFFRRQMHSLISSGIQPARLGHLMGAPEHGPAPHFAVTFDDAYSSIGRHAWPILQELNVPATLFVVAGLIGKSNEWDQRLGDRVESLLGPAELRQMAADGFEIGSHTLTHARLTELSPTALRDEIISSKRILEDLLGRSVDAFSYPYGAWNEQVRDVVMEAGYRYATATTLGAVTAQSDPFTLPRINIRWNTVGPRLWKKIGRAHSATEGA